MPSPNPYDRQLFLFVSNAEKGAMGQFMRDFGDDLEGFHNDEDSDMTSVSANGQGPPDGWTFSSWTTVEQLTAFSDLQHEMPPSTILKGQLALHQTITYDEWLSELGMQRMIPDDDVVISGPVVLAAKRAWKFLNKPLWERA